jgi:signal transduction histidine kinase
LDKHTLRPLGFRRSIFLKLLAAYLISSVLIFAMLSGFLELLVEDDDNPYAETTRATFVRLLASELDPGIDASAGEKFSEARGLDIAVEGPRGAWTTFPQFPSISKMESSSFEVPGVDGIRLGRLDRHRYGLARKDGARIAFIFGKEPIHEGWVKYIPLLILSIMLVLFLCYLFIRRLFQPLEVLHSGFSDAGSGNLDVQVSIPRTDELGELGRSFNLMLTGLREGVRSKEQLLLDISHELRSPLTRIKLALEIGDAASGDVARKNVRELEKMIHELLESARLDSPRGVLNLESVDLGTLVGQVISDYAGVTPGITFQPPLRPCVLDIDGDRIAVVVRNVLENSMKYSGDQQVPVEVGLEERDGVSGRKAVLTVHDFGQGIPSPELGAIFEPFYRIDKSRGRSSGGYGLGLNLCRKIMIAHGGEMEASSRLGEGTIMRLIFNSKNRT